jgi:hypothetical protein
MGMGHKYSSLHGEIAEQAASLKYIQWQQTEAAAKES